MASSGPCDVQGETLLGLTLQGLHTRREQRQTLAWHRKQTQLLLNELPTTTSSLCKFNTNLHDVFSILESEYFPEYNIISSEKAAFAKPLPN